MSLVLGVTILCLASMIYLYVHKIHRPLKQVVRATKEMSNGNLSDPIRPNGRDEVGELAGVINDLAANYQEVLLLTGTAVGKSSSAVERIEKVLDQGRQIGRPGGTTGTGWGYQERFGDAGLCSEGLRVLSDSLRWPKSRSHREGTSG